MHYIVVTKPPYIPSVSTERKRNNRNIDGSNERGRLTHSLFKNLQSLSRYPPIPKHLLSIFFSKPN